MSPPESDIGDEPPYLCARCPRLFAFLSDLRANQPDWYNGPVPSWGAHSSRLLIVGLAPGMKGANRTGRPFTGDYAGDLLYSTLLRFGWAAGRYMAEASDGLSLKGVRITNAVRCLPPANKPVASEINECNSYLSATINSMPRLALVLALGKVAHEAVIKSQGLRQKDFKFGHGNIHRLGRLKLIDSYHCSRYNTSTGVLTADMFDHIFLNINRLIG